MIASDYADYLPLPLPETQESNLQGWARAHQAVFDDYDDDLEYVIASHQIGRADGRDLDQLATRYGLLGRRYGRGDDAYRHYLQSLVGAYSGRGTVEDIKIAVGGGLVSERDQITVHQDFVENEFQLTIREWRDHNVGLVDQLAEVSRPAVVQRTSPIEYVLPDVDAGAQPGETHDRSVRVDFPPIEVGAEVGETDVVTTDSTGFGSNTP